mgnify:CR=1 FL=1
MEKIIATYDNGQKKEFVAMVDAYDVEQFVQNIIEHVSPIEAYAMLRTYIILKG